MSKTLEEIIRGLIEGAVRTPTYGRGTYVPHDAGRGGSGQGVGGARNRGVPGYPVPPEMAHRGGAEDPGSLEILEAMGPPPRNPTKVVTTPEFRGWYKALPPEARKLADHLIGLLQLYGRMLGEPYSRSFLGGSKLRYLRHATGQYPLRIPYVLTGDGAVALTGDNKKGQGDRADYSEKLEAIAAKILQKYQVAGGGQPHVKEDSEKKHSGTCVMLTVPEDAAKRLAELGTEPADDMHITLFYKKGLTEEQMDTVEAVMGDLWTERAAPIELSLETVGSFEPSESSDGKKVIYAKVEGDEVPKFREELIRRLAEDGIEPDGAHPDFKPHITLAYIEPDEGMPISIDEPIPCKISDFKVQRGSNRVDEVVQSEAMDPTELPKGIEHLEDLSPDEFMSFLRKYAELPIKGGLEISEKVDGSARMSFGVDERGLWTQTKNGQRKYGANAYPHTPMFRAVKAAAEQLDKHAADIRANWPAGVDFMVAEVLHTKIPNSIEYGPDAILIHGVHGEGVDPKQAAEQLTKAVNLDPWVFQYKTIIPHGDMMVDVSVEVKTLGELYRELQKLHPDRRRATGKEPYKAALAKFQEVQRKVKAKMVGQLRTRRSAYGPEGGDVEGVVFQDLDSGKLVKLVDKDYFTKLNKYYWQWRELLEKGIKVGDEWHVGVMQKLRNMISDDVFGTPIAKTPGFVKHLVEYGESIDIPERIKTPQQRADFVLARWIQENALMEGDFVQRFLASLNETKEEFRLLAKKWAGFKAHPQRMDFADDSGNVFKSREFPKEIIARTDEAFREVEATLAGMEKGAEVAASLKSPLTQKVALMKLMLGHRFDKLVGTQELTEGPNWKAMAAAGALALPGVTSNLTPPPPQPKVQASKPSLDQYIGEVAQEFKLPVELIRAVMGVESGGDPKATSPRGAKGMMQLMPKTAKSLGVKDPHDPYENIKGGARYLRKLVNAFRGNVKLALAAYNMGPNALVASLRSGEEWPEETQDYVQKVTMRMGGKLPKLQVESVALRDRGPTDLGGGMTVDGRMGGEMDEAEVNPPNPHADMIGVTIGRYQPFHAGHAAIIRSLANRFQKVVVFVAGQRQDKKNPFSHELRLELMKASLPDVWSKLEVYPAQVAGKGTGYVPGLLSWIGQSGQSSVTPGAAVNVLVGEDRLDEVRKQIEHNKQHSQEDGYFKGVIQVSALPGVRNDDDAGRISGTRVRQALVNDDRESVRGMLDPRVSSDQSEFERLFAEMRRQLEAMGLVSKVTEAVLKEFGMGALETSPGGQHTGGWGSSAWSRAWLAQDDADAESMYQKALGSPNRMLPMSYHPIDAPANPLPGQNSIDDGDEDLGDGLEEPTDLGEAVARIVTRVMGK